MIKQTPERGLLARAADQAIFVEVDNETEFYCRVCDVVTLHFEGGSAPLLSRMYFVRDEIIVS
ncbi:MAG TPA: hypothetical protein VFN25_10970 [Dokdonella sp.]|uniref:hypothetical protein n=1 Tax=Dokdonella sp. TaxID=2291710 RepID=UPI002D7F18DF|nr:hypothetical protein [Dokdonella sp.]HET9033415.1 hypothetical protein [Dokdonella sp.]